MRIGEDITRLVVFGVGMPIDGKTEMDSQPNEQAQGKSDGNDQKQFFIEFHAGVILHYLHPRLSFADWGYNFAQL